MPVVYRYGELCPVLVYDSSGSQPDSMTNSAIINHMNYLTSIMDFVLRKNSEIKKIADLNKILTAVAALSFVIGITVSVFKLADVSIWIFAVSLVAGGVPVFMDSVRSLVKRKISISLLVTIATFGALFLGQIAEAAAVMFFFALSEAFEDYGEDRSKKAIEALIERSPKVARLKGDREIPVEQIKVGDVIIARPGDIIPIDGVITDGESAIDEATITGESIPKEKFKGESVYSGTLCQSGYLEIKATKTVENSAVGRIIKLIEQAHKSRPEMQQFLDKFASYYIPVAIGLSLLVAIVPPLFFGQPFNEWLTRSLVLLVLACPDALVVSAPVAVAAAIGGASRKGVLIKGGRFLEVLSKIKAIAFDKTKTLTVGRPIVTKVIVFNGASKEDVLGDAAGLEELSSHPLARAIEEYAKENNIKPHRMRSFKNIVGRGSVANCVVCEDREHAIGNLQHIGAGAKATKEVLKAVEQLESDGMTAVLVREKDKIIGIIGIVDELRPESKLVIDKITKFGVVPVMLTGDNVHAAKYIGKQVGIKETYGALLPEQKAELIDKLQSQYGKVAMVGDGVNDAPSLARADVGIAMGGSGSDVAIESADITLMNDKIENITYLISLGKQTFTVIKQNVYGSLIVKGVILVAGIVGVIGLPVAVAADAGMAILVVLNGLRLFNASETK